MRKHVGAPLALFLVLTSITLSFAYSKEKVVAERAKQVGNHLIIIDALASHGELERSPVSFPHGQHTAAMPEARCDSCHDTSSSDSGTRFQFKNTQGLTFDEAKNRFHDDCISCHAEREAADKATGPQICSGCHINDVETPESSKVRFDAALHATHGEKANLDCASCHHAFDATVEKAVYAKGEEGSCVYCHKEAPLPTAEIPKGMPATSLQTASHEQCIVCHLETGEALVKADKPVQTGPVECQGCHASMVEEKASMSTRLPETLRLKRNQPDAVLMGSKRAGSTAMVPFDHKSHELADISCQTCHHKAIASCTECHTTDGDLKGGGVTLEAAMHTQESDRSCVACHNEVKKAPECAGCHQMMAESRPSESDSCISCHAVKKETGKAIPQGAELEMMVAKRRTMRDGSWQKKAPVSVTIDALAKEYKPSEFPHKIMVDALAAETEASGLATAFHGSDKALCIACHHNAPATETPAKCSSCHSPVRQAKTSSKPDLMGAFHIQCMECHDTMEVSLEGECTACHASLTKVSNE